MMTVKEVSQLTGVSIRALQYYDKIGLLTPSRRTEAGYRLYQESDLHTLQQILLFRELEFPLKEIRAILASPDYDRQTALQQQMTLLTLKKEHLENLISLTRELLKGDNTMNFEPFDTSKQEAYARHARQQWGSTEAYQEYAHKHAQRPEAEEVLLSQGLMEIFADFGKCKESDPFSPEAQALAARLQRYITDHYYTCTKPILATLGQMYLSEEFTRNIDNFAGPGTAQFAADAIEIYCS